MELEEPLEPDVDTQVDHAVGTSLSSPADDGSFFIDNSTASWRLKVLRCVFPFLMLGQRAPEGGKKGRAAEEIFLMMGLLWMLASALFVYLLLTMSCWSREELKSPEVGSHYPWFLLAKRLLAVWVMNHLCKNLMEPVPGMSSQRIADIDKIHPIGVIHHARALAQTILCRKVMIGENATWLSSFVADHILLMLCGFLSVLHHVSLGQLKLQTLYGPWTDEHAVRDIGTYVGNSDGWTIISSEASCVYMSVLVVGFLYCALEFNVVEKAGRGAEFKAFFGLFIFLWCGEFLAVLLERQIYMSAWAHVNSQFVQRILSAFAQIFITHSTVMLCAVFLGHSCHFKRCPDLT